MNEKKVLVTGGLGFIGSNLIRRIEETSPRQVVVVDNFGNGNKWKNIALRRNVRDFIPIENCTEYLTQHLSEICAVIHLGAISSTTEKDVDKLIKTNFYQTIELQKLCTKHSTPFIYASSASVYGNSLNFDDNEDPAFLASLRPMNAYGWTKKLIDYQIACDGGFQNHNHQTVGLRFFNVYGPNEYHKGNQASVFYHFYNQILNDGCIKLFKSTHPELDDGEQKRDFVYVDDCADVILWLLDNPQISGIYNVGTGIASSYNLVAKQICKELNLEFNIDYIDMPNEISRHYQNFTKSNSSKIFKAGYNQNFRTITEGIHQYFSILRSNEKYL